MLLNTPNARCGEGIWQWASCAFVLEPIAAYFYQNTRNTRQPVSSPPLTSTSAPSALLSALITLIRVKKFKSHKKKGRPLPLRPGPRAHGLLRLLLASSESLPLLLLLMLSLSLALPLALSISSSSSLDTKSATSSTGATSLAGLSRRGTNS